MASKRRKRRLSRRVRVSSRARPVSRARPKSKSVTKKKPSKVPRPARPARPIPSPTAPTEAPLPSWMPSDPRRQREQLRYLNDTLKELRRTFTGFETRNGYDLRSVRNWTQEQVHQVQAYGGELHTLTSTPHVWVIPKTGAQRQALQLKTGQALSRQKRYAIHVPSPKNTRVNFVRDRKRNQVRVEVRRQVRFGEVIVQDYLFREMIGYQPRTFPQMKKALKKLLPQMPNKVGKEPAYYTLLTEPHGPISVPMRKNRLMHVLQRYHIEYEGPASALHPDFAEVVIGFRLQGTLTDAITEEKKRRDQSREHRRLKYEQRLERRRIGPRGKRKRV